MSRRGVRTSLRVLALVGAAFLVGYLCGAPRAPAHKPRREKRNLVAAAAVDRVARLEQQRRRLHAERDALARRLAESERTNRTLARTLEERAAGTAQAAPPPGGAVRLDPVVYRYATGSRTQAELPLVGGLVPGTGQVVRLDAGTGANWTHLLDTGTAVVRTRFLAAGAGVVRTVLDADGDGDLDLYVSNVSLAGDPGALQATLEEVHLVVTPRIVTATEDGVPGGPR